MKNGLCVIILFILISPFLFVANMFCGTNVSIANTNAIIKIIPLINDTNKVLAKGDPYAIMQIMEKLKIEIKYVDFSQATSVQLKEITDFIIKNIGSKQKQTSKVFIPFVLDFVKKLGVNLNLFFKEKDSQKVIVSFANQMVKKLPGLMPINPGSISQLIPGLQGIISAFS